MIGGRKFMLVVGDNIVVALVLSVIAIMGWVGMEVIGREHAGTARKGWPHSGICQSTSCVRGGNTVDR